MARLLGVRGGMDHPLAPFFLGRRNVIQYVIELEKSEFKNFTAFHLVRKRARERDMDQWEGTIISVPASKIQESLGLTNSLHDRDIWQLFLVSSRIYIPLCHELPRRKDLTVHLGSECLKNSTKRYRRTPVTPHGRC